MTSPQYQTDARTMLNAAQQYAAMGISILPLQPPTTTKVIDEKERKQLGKAPASLPGFYNGSTGATQELEKINLAWGKDLSIAPCDTRNIGIATGEKHNLVIVDVDKPELWETLLASHGYELPDCAKVTTSKGYHLYFAYPKGRKITNSQNTDLGFDIRAAGGLGVAPPSNHQSGAVYELVSKETLDYRPELPEWVFVLVDEYNAMRKAKNNPAANTTLNFTASIPASSDSTPWAMAGLDGECQTIASTLEGSRNGNLNKGSFRVGQLVAGGELASHIAISALRHAGLQCGLPASEVEKTLKSGYQEGLHSPRVSGEATRPEGSSLDITKLIEAKPRLSALDQLSAYTANGRSAEMRQQMLDDKYVLDRIAIRGQWTTLYAAPNGGKTLLTLWMLIQQVKAGEIDGSKIYYVNADDHYKGQVEKLELLEPHKINVLLPNHNGFDTDKLTQLIGQLTKDKQAMGQVIILDTLKKFTDLMDKKASSEFGKLARTFVGAGGTIIALAHTNKNKDDAGKSVAGGTSDIMDDCDCAFMIDGSGPDGHNKYRAVFENNKARGDVAQKVAFQYSKLDGCTYEQLLNSIVRLGKKEAKAADKENQLRKDIRVDKTTVDAILEALGDGKLSTKAILSHVTEETPIGRRPTKIALLKWTGEDYAQGHRWTVRQGDKNEKLYPRLANH
ncbi:MAG: hypothetical protein HN436_03095, partial [Oceanospirillaceae bacterium]|nr:hypothetical protein [Oceanospirillaceae bacterium]